MPILRPSALSPHYDPSQPYDPPMTSTATAMRFSTIAKANINAISSAPGHSPATAGASSSLHPNASTANEARRKSAVSFREDLLRGSSRDEEADTRERERAKKAIIKERAKARLTIEPTPTTPRTPKTAEIMAEVDGTLDILRENMGRLSARGESIEHLEARTEGLARSAQAFRRSSKRVRREMQWKELKMRLIIAFVIFVVLGLTILSIVQAVRNSQGPDLPVQSVVVSVAPASVAAPTPKPTVSTTTVPSPAPTPPPLPTPALTSQDPAAEALPEIEGGAEGGKGAAGGMRGEEGAVASAAEERELLYDWLWEEE